ncbi:MAG TPA: ATP-binding protein [Candidatus Binataceae bacterium]|nr:ATP-binding protein [Candidatus Binataceae bacterium]
MSRLRARFLVAFLLLQLIPTIAIAMFSLSYAIKNFVNGIADSGNLMTEQIYEQIRTTLEASHTDPAAALLSDAPLKALLASTQAFGWAVVSARVLDPQGTVMVAPEGQAGGKKQPPLPSMGALQSTLSSWWPFPALHALLIDREYAISRPIEIAGRPFATISVTITTTLLAAQTRSLAIVFAAFIAVDLIAVLVAATILRNLMFDGFSLIAAGLGRSDEARSIVGAGADLSGLAERFKRLSLQVHSESGRWESKPSHAFDMIRSIRDGVMLLDGEGTLLFANPEAHAVLGLTRTGTAEGRPLSVLLRKNHPLVLMAEAAIESGAEAHDVPIKADDPDSERASMLVSFFRLGTSRSPMGLLLVLRDMNAVHELENVVEYSSRLARLGALISGVAHQLRSPLQAMALRLSLLHDDAAAGRDIDRHLEHLRSDVRRLDQSVEAMLRFMRPAELKISEFNPNDLLTELAASVKSANVTIALRLDPALPVIKADRAMVSEALANVIQNAVQAMPGGGPVTLHSAARNGMVELEVSDLGEGVAPEKLEQIFDLYYTTKREGSGLGLPLALRAIELNHGTIEIASNIGEGTTCKVRFPVAADASRLSIDSANSPSA